MSEVTVSISLTRAQQGALWMKSNRQAERIIQLKKALREIIELAIADQNFTIKTKAEAALQKPATGSGNE